MKKLLLLLLFSVSAFAQPNIGEPITVVVCDQDEYTMNGATFVDLTVNNTIVLNGLSPDEYSVSYYETEQYAVNGTNAIENPQAAYVSNGQSIFIKVAQIGQPANFAIAYFSIVINIIPIINNPTALVRCNEALPNDFMTSFDLTTKDNEITGDCIGCSVEYFWSENNSLIDNPTNFTNYTNPQVLNVKVTSVNGCEAYTTLTIKVLPLPLYMGMPDLYSCNGIFDLTQNNNLYDSSFIITHYATLEDALNNVNPFPNPTTYSSQNGIVFVRVAIPAPNPNEPVCSQIYEQQLVVNNLEVEGIASVGNDIVITLNSSETYLYTISSAPTSAELISQNSNIFTDMPFGSYTFVIQNSCGNIVTITFDHILTAPLGETTQTFTEGETLANLEVEGENIQWYATETGDNLLNIETLLVDGAIYYASQTIDGVESTQRLGVTVTKVLGLDNDTIPGLSYFPNPVKNTFTVTNSNTIDDISVYNTLGQLVLTTAINSTEGTIDFSAFNNGIYFIKVTAGKNQQTIKVVKQ
ncbi:T9SS type A sorting domain-containing protein [Flavobacterium zepuense]|uniref:T9SS type A sorting domain-containing protein n=1 Tax=Flavobacterium zepuense TaxID=2593302 RepID=A0A552V8C0_9FLAO|nr:T9SS type A sorting domain-containing protein [Flavobacterium zepuense]TRW26708.1 T9SS type A sorting domain-containing protein [Flavobacterium zepuense]